MPLESCPTCGYALPVLDHRCRHCPVPLSVFPSSPFFDVNHLSTMIGAVLCIAGLAFCVWARFTLGRNWSGLVTLKGGHELITSGPYAFVRHPIYTGLLTMCVATALVLGHIAGIIAIPFVIVSLWVK